MFSMIKCDLACLRGVARSLAGTALFVAAIFALAMGASGVLCAATIVIALSVVNRLMAYDEQNNWQAFRQALPLSRSQVVCGRYVTVALCVLASLLVGIAVTLLTDLVISVVVSMHPGLQLNSWSELLDLSLRLRDLVELFVACGAAGVAVSFFGLALTLPFMFRFGFTKGTRYIPLVFVALSLLVFGYGGHLVERIRSCQPCAPFGKFRYDCRDIACCRPCLSGRLWTVLPGLPSFVYNPRAVRDSPY